MRRREFIAGLGSAATWPVVARAAAGGAGDRLAQRPEFRNRCPPAAGVSPGTEQTRLCRRTERDDRVPVVGYSTRSTAGSRGGPRPPSGSRYCYGRRGRIGGAGSSRYHHDDSDCQCHAICLARHGFQARSRQRYRCIRHCYRAGGKRIRLLHDLLPRATTIAVLTTPSLQERTDAQEAARVSLGSIKFLIASTDHELDEGTGKPGPNAARCAHCGGRWRSLFFTRANKIVAAALAIPAMYFRREFVLASGLARLRNEH